jgi:hypothetical protein
MFQVTRVYSDSNGDSHFEDVEIPLNESGSVGRLSEVLPANGVVFREVEPSYNWNFHTAPQKQYIIYWMEKLKLKPHSERKEFLKQVKYC